MEDANQELEQFRQQWRAEVSARNQNDTKKGSKSSRTPRRPPPISSLSLSTVNAPIKEEGEGDEPAPQMFAGYDGSTDKEQGESSESASKEPQSALDHYEKAVEREIQGSLGDSLNLYRKAFRVSASHRMPFTV
jgi:F-box protein 9